MRPACVGAVLPQPKDCKLQLTQIPANQAPMAEVPPYSTIPRGRTQQANVVGVTRWLKLQSSTSHTVLTSCTLYATPNFHPYHMFHTPRWVLGPKL